LIRLFLNLGFKITLFFHLALGVGDSRINCQLLYRKTGFALPF